ncbi:hypothetical protein ACI0FS_03585, partial [Ochrobactrum quorumnocens]|uniref:hypothetical protein n=1 Tax=Ochrobactrum quorumnocens TaxID=271865 RepID=UPI003853E4E0
DVSNFKIKLAQFPATNLKSYLNDCWHMYVPSLQAGRRVARGQGQRKAPARLPTTRGCACAWTQLPDAMRVRNFIKMNFH